MCVDSKLVAKWSESWVKVSSADGIKSVGRWKVIRKKFRSSECDKENLWSGQRCYWDSVYVFWLRCVYLFFCVWVFCCRLFFGLTLIAKVFQVNCCDLFSIWGNAFETRKKKCEIIIGSFWKKDIVTSVSVMISSICLSWYVKSGSVSWPEDVSLDIQKKKELSEIQWIVVCGLGRVSVVQTCFLIEV